MKRLTFLFSIMVMLLVSGLISETAWATTVVVRARGTAGDEQIRLTVGSTTIQTWTLTTSMANYSASFPPYRVGECLVAFINDANGRDVQVDYITVNSTTTRQAEDQAINTGCGGAYSEWLYCNGYINFGWVGNKLSASPTSLYLAAGANSAGVFDVNSDTSWTASSSQTWLTLSPASGSNNGTVTATAQETTSTSPRTATVTFSGTNAAPKLVTVIQAPILSVTPKWLLAAAAENSTCIFNIASIKSWTVSSDQTWLTVSPASGSNNGTVTLTAHQNTDPSTRTATVTVSAPGVSQTVTVIQRCAGGGECDVLPMPAFSNLWDNPKCPDPFTFLNGTRMTTKTEWASRRAEIAALAQKFEYGYKQDTPYSATTGSMNGNSLIVTVTDNGQTISFSCSITYPGTGSAPYPAMIACGFSSLNNTELSNMGVAVINFPSDEIAQENGPTSRGVGKFYDMYGSSHSAGALMAWAWGMDRLIDAIEKTSAANIDPTRLGVTGCSRWGKGALACGAFDERIKLTIPEESGSGGSASWRVSDWQMSQGTNVQTQGEIVGENCWFRDDFNQFNTVAIKLPFDHHMVAALCAPDALLFIENSSQVWLGDVSTWANGNFTHRIWEALGIPDKMGYSSVGNHNHCAFPPSQQPEVTAYIQKFLVGGGTGDTNVMKIDGGETYNESQWIDWTVPDLQLSGDFDSSDRVDFMDLAILANAWLSDPIRTNWDGRCDIAKPPDNVINILDLAIFAQNWFKVDSLDSSRQ